MAARRPERPFCAQRLTARVRSQRVRSVEMKKADARELARVARGAGV